MKHIFTKNKVLFFIKNIMFKRNDMFHILYLRSISYYLHLI